MDHTPERLGAEWTDQTVSHGTMRIADLWPDFIAVLDTVNHDRALQLDADFADSAEDEQDELMGRLFDALDDVAPAGTSFGAHPGDGSDYGFWTYDDSGLDTGD